MRLFLDTCIIVDIIDADRPEHNSALLLLQLAADNPGRLSLFTSDDALATAAYVMRHDQSAFRATASTLLKYIDILPTGREMLLGVCGQEHPDFEDAMHIACAGEYDCSGIITRNRKHYEGYTSLRVFSPAEFMAL